MSPRKEGRRWRVWRLWLSGPRVGSTETRRQNWLPEVGTIYGPRDGARWKCIWVEE